MALERLTEDLSYRFMLAHKLAIADISAPTDDELNANSSNVPSALIFNVTCALNTDGTTFDLDDPELDDTTSFCQRAGSGDVLTRSATVVFEYFMDKRRWTDATSTSESDGYNVANLTHSLLAWRGQEYLAIMSVGKAPDAAFAAGDRVKIAQVATDYAIPNISSGAPITWVQTFAKRTDLAWNVEVVEAA